MTARDRRFVLAFPLVIALLGGAGCGPTNADTPPGGDGGVPDRPVGNEGGGGGDSGGGDDGSVAPTGSFLILLPADAKVSVAQGARASLDYWVILRSPGTYDIEVTAEASFWVDDTALGSFSGAHFTGAPDAVGQTTVRAAARGLVAETPLTLAVQSVVIGTGAAADAPTKFGGADDPSRAPTIVYPESGVLVPPNLNEFQFHFMPGTGNTVFHLAFRKEAIAIDVYFGCTALGGGCVFVPDETTWTILSQSLRGLGAATYTLRGVDGASPGGVGTSAEQTILFGEQDIRGGIYYWNAGAGNVRRYDFGRRGQTAENYMDRQRAGAAICVGCHVMSNDGRRIAVGLDMPAPSPYKVFDVATRTLIYNQGSMAGGGANFFSFSPDGSQILTSGGVNIVWRDATNGTPYTPTPLVPVGTMPDWSPDGSKMVFAKSHQPPPTAAPGVTSAELALMTFNGTSWSSATTLVPYNSQNNYYPTFSPDSAWVLFNRSPSNHDSYDSPDAELWTVAAGGGTPIHLARASTGGDSWPKWATTVQTYNGKPLMWLTFSSRRAFGLQLAAGTRAQIWMTAFDPEAAAAGQDASYPAFWLPFQELESGNHIAQWVTEVVRQPCTTGDECEGNEFCENGRCVPPID